MKYYKIALDGYIVSYGSGNGGIEIEKNEYESIKNAAASVLTPPDGYAYKLRADTLEWELVELPPPDPDPDIDNAEAIEILLGGAT